MVIVPKLLLSSVRIRDFDQKQPNLTQNWHFWSIRARPCWLIWCSVGGLVGGRGAWAVSRKKPIYFILFGPVAKITILIHSVLYKVNRFLARYSPRATTTNRTTNRAPNESAMDKNANFGPNLDVFGQKILFFTGEIKSFVTHITKPTQAPCSHC